MIIKVSDEVQKLADIFEKRKVLLFAVGGYVRSQILGIAPQNDIDLCSSATPQEVRKILKDSEFEVLQKSEKLGVVQIKTKNGDVFDHATFRTEVYEIAGEHTPSKVEFVKSLDEDSYRRDFTINAVYYDISNCEIIDPFGGVEDINNKLLKTIISPSVVFRNDALRILRMVRLACSLCFDIDDATYSGAKNNISKLALLTKTRIRDEFSRIIQADLEFPCIETRYAHMRGIAMLTELQAWKYIIPEFEDVVYCNYRGKNGETVLQRTLSVVGNSKPEIRLSALLHMIGVPQIWTENGNTAGYELESSKLSEKSLGKDGLNYSKEIVERVKRIIAVQNALQKPIVFKRYKRMFIISNLFVIDYICMLKNSIKKSKYNINSISLSAAKIALEWKKMQKEQVPLFVSDLNVTGTDIVKKYPKVQEKYLATILNELHMYCVLNKEHNNHIWLLNRAGKIIRKNRFEEN